MTDDTADIYSSFAASIIFTHRLPIRLGGVRLELERGVVVVKPIGQNFEIGRGAGVRQALDDALRWILDCPARKGASHA